MLPFRSMFCRLDELAQSRTLLRQLQPSAKGRRLDYLDLFAQPIATTVRREREQLQIR
jgi:hypothetical protein